MNDEPKKVPSLRTLLARAVGALERIAELAEYYVEIVDRATPAEPIPAAVVPAAVERCNAPFTIAGVVQDSIQGLPLLGGELHTEGAIGDVKCTRPKGHDDDLPIPHEMHMYRDGKHAPFLWK
jgi:hypothetical protein